MSDVIFFSNEKEFENWLLLNYSTKNEIWLGYYKKKTGLCEFDWSQSVDVALCYGWIDGIRKSIDDSRYKIRFTPRNANSVWSAVNIKKVKKLIQLGRMKPEGLKLYKSRKDIKGYSVTNRNVELKRIMKKNLERIILRGGFLQN